ncbi:hypothetical protein A9F13_01g05951 [Clavispora lusitaniae]|uniref:FHA domain-containing protein n=1 Tax=Clavispora lusitaniae TaxID=36911 RepID=A0AA91Q524_CLALS|nr:hypothetical protein A9F13_01g05951 [Clavispora lusitaniae]
MSQLESSGFNVSELFQTSTSSVPESGPALRKRSNSQSQVVASSMYLPPRLNSSPSNILGRGVGSASHHMNAKPQKRHQAEYYVTLAPLNDTFVKKHIHVPYYPETCKLGRPTGTKIKPHVNNGYFDSRVLSRTHACMYIEPKTGQLMIQDMGSSNGTFVNQNKIGAEPVPINIGDSINLGFNIQIETSHKQISARIENINIVSNNPTGPVLSGLPNLTQDDINKFSASEMRHFDFIQRIFASLSDNKDKEFDESVEEEENESFKAFERAMFGDIFPSLEDALASTSEDSLNAGIFKNSLIVNAPNVGSTIDTLMANLALVKQQNSSLSSLETYLKNYTTKMDELNSRFLKAELEARDQEFQKKLKVISLENEMEKDRHRSVIEKLEEQVHNLKLEKAELDSKLQKQMSSAKAEETDKPDANGTLDRTTQTSNGVSKISRIVDATCSDVKKTSNIATVTPAAKVLKTPSSGSPDESKNDQCIPIRYEKDDDEGKSSVIAHHTPESNDSVTEPSAAEYPYLRHLSSSLASFRNQGVILGVVVVVAGYLYQTSNK